MFIIFLISKRSLGSPALLAREREREYYDLLKPVLCFTMLNFIIWKIYAFENGAII